MKKKQQKTLVLLDAHAIIHRAYHALPNFSSSKGEATGALYGLSTMLIKIINDFDPDHVVACFDLPEPTYRHKAYEEYKAGRAKTDDELVSQLEKAKEAFEAFGVPIYESPGFEADDILGTIVEQMKKNKDLSIIIASGDMDTMQLVDNEKVSVYTLKKGIQDTVLYTEKEMKERFGFGPELLPDFKGLSGDPSDNIIGVKGIGAKTATTLVQEFGTIEEILEIAKNKPEQMEKKGIKPRIINLLLEGEEEAIFSKMLATIRTDAPITFTLPKKRWKEELSIEKVETLFSELEFRNLGSRVRELIGEEEEESEGEEIDEGELKKILVGVWLLDSNLTDPSKDDLLHYTKTKRFEEAKEVVEKELKENNMWDLYAQIELPLIPILEWMKERGIQVNVDELGKLSEEYKKELKLIEEKIWKEAGREFNISSPKQIGEVLFDELELSAKGLKKTATGARSTKESELEKMRDEHPIVEHILEHRGLSKLISTYLDPIGEMVDKKGVLHADFIQTGTTTGRMSSAHPNLQNIPARSDAGTRIRKIFTARKGFTLVAFDYSQIELRIAAILSGDEHLKEIFTSHGDIHQGVASRVFHVKEDEVTKEMRRQAKVINFGILYGMGVNALKQNLGTTQSEARDFLDRYFEQFPGLAEYMEGTKKEAGEKGYTETMFGRRRYFSGLHSSASYIRASAERMAINAPIQGTEADIIKKAMVEVDSFLTKEKMSDEVYPLLQVHDELVYEMKKERCDEVIPDIKRLMEDALPKEQSAGIPIVVEVEAGENWRDLESYNV